MKRKTQTKRKRKRKMHGPRTGKEKKNGKEKKIPQERRELTGQNGKRNTDEERNKTEF
jgi:hypothetical protein